MPEYKRIPKAGVINRDVTDRLLHPDQTREALNINIGESESSDVGSVENLLGNELVAEAGIEGGVCLGSYRDNGNERIYFFVTSNNALDQSQGGEHGVFEFDQTTNLTTTLATGLWLNFHTDFTITGINLVDELLFWTDNRNEPRKINIERARNNPTFYTSDDLAAVAKYAPFEAPSITTITNSVDVASNFLEDKLPRFAYRWKFNDGEFSTISPFTPICFLGATSASIDPDAGEISSFINTANTIGLNVPTPDGFGITEVEFLYKETRNSNVYIIHDTLVDTETTDNVSYVYQSQDPFRTLPGNQLTRVYDAIPRVAKAQELAGGRIVYGNFLQNYDVPDISFTIDIDTTDTHPQLVRHSVKSRRTYQVGIVLADRYGRQSPVILSSTGGDSIFVEAQTGNVDDVLQRLRITFNTALPSWAYSYRVVVKQRQQEYYNVLSTSNSSVIERFGDTVNKIPIDTTALAESLERLPSATSVYPKIISNVNNTDNSLIKVQYINGEGTGIIIPGAPSSGNVVYETEPVESLLDIFFETSTGAIIPTDPPSHEIFVATISGSSNAAAPSYTATIVTPNGRSIHISGTFNAPINRSGLASSIASRFNASHSDGGYNAVHDGDTVIFTHKAFGPDNGDLTINLGISGFSVSVENTQNGVIHDGIPDQTVIDFYNCYILDIGALHIEVNRLRVGFNEAFFDIGVKAYVVQDNFSEERRFNTLIHSSGLFNSRVGINFINQFNEAEGGITVSLDPQDGSIQKIYAEDTQLIIWQEDKVSRSPIDKDFIYSAEGGQVPVTSNTQYLGTIAPFQGEYGISTDPESFAIYGTTKYFSDKNRGVILSLVGSSLTEISKNGMTDFFRDILRTSNQVIGSFDEYHDQYNLTVVGDNYNANPDTNIATADDGYFTISFSTNVGGWSSFKSFRQESGLTLNNTYYTFSGGDGWEHNSDNVDRNSFYGEDSAESYVVVIFNDQPSDVKEFKTLSYEGTNTWECQIIETDLALLGDVITEAIVHSATLQLIGTVDNIVVSGARTYTREEGEEVTWLIVFSPISSNYEFNNVSNVVIAQRSDDDADVTLVSKELFDGNIYQIVTFTITDEDVLLRLDISGAASPAFVGALLTINISDNIVFTSISPASFTYSEDSFDQNGDTEDTVVYRLTPDEGYYYDTTFQMEDANGDFPIVIDNSDITDAGLLVSSVAANDGFDVMVTLTVSKPTLQTTRVINVTGRGPDILGVNTFESAEGDPFANSTITLTTGAEVNLRIGETMEYQSMLDPVNTHIFTDVSEGSLTLTNDNDAVSVPSVSETLEDDGRLSYSFTVSYDDEPTEWTLTYTAEPELATLDDPSAPDAFDDSAFTDGTNTVSVAVTSNVNWTLGESAHDGGGLFLTAVRNGDNIDITVLSDNTGEDARVNTIFVHPPQSGPGSNLDVQSFDVTQNGTA